MRSMVEGPGRIPLHHATRGPPPPEIRGRNWVVPAVRAIILHAMPIFPRPSTPRALWHDLTSFAAERGRHRILIAIVSVLIPMVIVLGFYVDSRVEEPPLGVIYVENWPADRSDAEIVAQQKIDQAKRDAAIEKKRQEFQRADEALERMGL
jgi:hypothetical protein